METQGIDKGMAFSGNPIRMIGDDGAVHSIGTFHIKVNGTEVFSGVSTKPICVNIADVVNANIDYLPEATNNTNEIYSELIDIGELPLAEYWVEGEENDLSEVVSFIPLKGGISKQNYMKMLQMNSGIFTNRFLNAGCNLFMTTRTNSWKLVMRETELAPIYFWAPSNDGMRITETTTGRIWHAETSSGCFCSLDIAKLRTYFATTENVLPSQFDISFGDTYACRIVIEEATTANERYRLKFRNSLGVFEIIEIVGEMSLVPTFGSDGDDDGTFNEPDSVVDDFSLRRDRTVVTSKLSIEIPAERVDRRTFFIDMLSSEEVWLLDMAADPVRVIPEVEEIQLKLHGHETNPLTLTLTLADDDLRFMDDIVTGDEGHKPRVFSQQFSKQFN